MCDILPEECSNFEALAEENKQSLESDDLKNEDVSNSTQSGQS